MRNKKRNKPKVVTKHYRTNEYIRSPQVQVIDEKGEALGAMDTQKALDLANQAELDLVEVSPLADPPVCKIMDYGKFQYKQNRSQQKTKKVDTKGIRLSFKIGEHDLLVRKKQTEKFLNKGHKVKIELRLKGRERGFRNQAKEIIKSFLEQLEVDHQMDKPEKPIEIQGPTLSTLIYKK